MEMTDFNLLLRGNRHNINGKYPCTLLLVLIYYFNNDALPICCVS